MIFSERMKQVLDQGVAASKDFAAKAGNKAQEIGEMGVLVVEIKQLESRAQKLIARLGNEVYAAFVENGQKTISSGSGAVKDILGELAPIKESIEKKEAELQTKKKK